MKKLLSVLLAGCMLFGLVACSGGSSNNGGETEDGPKIGVILVGDENEGYTYAHMEGIKNAAAKLGISDSQIL